MTQKGGLLDILARHAAERPDEVALRSLPQCDSRPTWTWRGLFGAARNAAFRAAEAARGGPLVVQAGNTPALVPVLTGAIAAGVDILPVSPRLTDGEIAELVALIGARSMVAGDDVVPSRASGTRPLRLSHLLAGVDGAGDLPGGGGLLLPTSGTTGEPKVVRRLEAALRAVGEALVSVHGLGSCDRVLLALPVCHSYAVDQMLAALLAGARLDIHMSFDPGLVRRALAKDEITTFPAVPVMLDVLSRGKARPAAPRLRRVISAGSPLPLSVFERFRRSFGVAPGQLYGATEFGSVTWNEPGRVGFDPADVGPALPGCALRIVDRRQRDPTRPLPPGREGLVAVAAPSLFTGYLPDSKAPFVEGFFVTEDLGVMDDEGSLRLTGRLAFMIDVGGRKVNPLEVESVLSDHPGVREVIVLAARYSETVRRLRAVVVPEPGVRLDREELRRFARSRLSPHKVPRHIEVRAEVPRSPTGKILRTALQSEATRP